MFSGCSTAVMNMLDAHLMQNALFRLSLMLCNVISIDILEALESLFISLPL